MNKMNALENKKNGLRHTVAHFDFASVNLTSTFNSYHSIHDTYHGLLVLILDWRIGVYLREFRYNLDVVVGIVFAPWSPSRYYLSDCVFMISPYISAEDDESRSNAVIH